MRWSVENGALAPESFAITGGRAVYSHISGETSDGKDTYVYDQYPSQKDINNLESDTNANYVFGRRRGTGLKVYIYNGLGIQATVPTKHFVNFK